MFRLQVLIKTTSVPHLGRKAIAYYGSELAVYELFDSNKVKDHDEETNQKVKKEALKLDPEKTDEVNAEGPVEDCEVDVSIEVVKAESLLKDGSGDNAGHVEKKSEEETVNRCVF